MLRHSHASRLGKGTRSLPEVICGVCPCGRTLGLRLRRQCARVIALLVQSRGGHFRGDALNVEVAAGGVQHPEAPLGARL